MDMYAVLIANDVEMRPFLQCIVMKKASQGKGRLKACLEHVYQKLYPECGKPGLELLCGLYHLLSNNIESGRRLSIGTACVSRLLRI